MAEEKAAIYFGAKKACVFTESLEHFNVTVGYPPDVAQRLVPVELFEHTVLCCLIKKNKP